MNRRTEARFQVYAPAKVTLLEEPDRDFAGLVLDVSGAGLRLTADVEFTEDQIITIETDQHLILADVRSCLPRGDKFEIGAERIHSAPKLALPATSSRVERNQVLIADFHNRINEELHKAPGHATSRPNGAAERFQASQFAAEPEAIEPEQGLESVAQEEPVAEPEPAAIIQLASSTEPAVEQPLVETHPAEVIEPVKIAEATTVETNDVPASFQVTAAEEPLAETHPAEVVEPVKTAEATTVETNDVPASFQVTAASAHARSRALAVLSAAALTLIAVGALLYGPLAKRAPLQTSVAAKSDVPVIPPAAAKPESVAKSPAVALPVKTQPAPPPAAPPAVPPAAPSAGKSHALLSATDRSWVTVCTDGKMTLSKLFVAGSKEDLAFSSSAVVRMGSAGPLQILLNGKSVGSLGNPGEVKVIELMPTGSRFMTPGEPGDCTR